MREANVIQTASEPLPRGDRIANALARLVYRRAERVIAVSEAVKEDVIARLGVPAERVTVAHNPVVSPALQALAAEPSGHPWLGDQPDVPVVLAAGRLARAKGFDILLAAFAQVATQREARLVILGEGKERKALQAQAQALGIADRVDLPGFRDNPFSYMREASLFVLSSRWEGLPNTLIQAMACGTPVISTDCPGGSAEILEEGRWGALVASEDPDALAAAMLRCLEKTEPGSDRSPPPARRAADFSEAAAMARYREVLGLTLQYEIATA
ncbi:glycosyltransferase [Halomonas sp. BC04]|uniref:glycosyltransferase n=1 Tax=Halomonas sp. BC04 TaxID=1403540 RepID=UPI0003ED88D2|nr:glycosyltransferase [Halomonas sp. BC04]EWG99102.1 hypothetical protein Q427_26915 [Halomonas sp. BC04]